MANDLSPEDCIAAQILGLAKDKIVRRRTPASLLTVLARAYQERDWAKIPSLMAEADHRLRGIPDWDLIYSLAPRGARSP